MGVPLIGVVKVYVHDHFLEKDVMVPAGLI